MATRTFQEQVIIRKHVYNYLERNGVTSLRDIVRHVKVASGIEITPSTVARLVREYGYEFQEEWVKK